VEIGQKIWKLVWMDRQTDGDGQTDRPIPIYTPKLRFRGYKKLYLLLPW